MTAVLHLGINPERFPQGTVERVRAIAPDYELLVTQDRATIEAELDRIEIAFGEFPHDLLPRATKLQWLQQMGAGADWLARHPEAQELSFTLTNASGVHAVPISEHMLGFLLALGRGFPACIRDQHRRVWEENRHQDLFELAGKRVLLLGVGAIGERFARLCAACEMEVVGVRRDPSRTIEGITRMVGPDAIASELPQVDVLANTLPYTEETHHLIGRAELGLIKEGSVVINIGRGGTIDEAAMIDALRSGTLRAAGLDVFEEEPLPDDSPLWDMESVIVTPHYSGLTPRYNERLFEIFIRNLERYRKGEPLENIVDKRIGY